MSAWTPPDPSDYADRYDADDYDGPDCADLHDAQRDAADEDVIPF
jgi:hypothetical protein